MGEPELRRSGLRAATGAVSEGVLSTVGTCTLALPTLLSGDGPPWGRASLMTSPALIVSESPEERRNPYPEATHHPAQRGLLGMMGRRTYAYPFQNFISTCHATQVDCARSCALVWASPRPGTAVSEHHSRGPDRTGPGCISPGPLSNPAESRLETNILQLKQTGRCTETTGPARPRGLGWASLVDLTCTHCLRIPGGAPQPYPAATHHPAQSGLLGMMGRQAYTYPFLNFISTCHATPGPGTQPWPDPPSP